MSNDDSFNDSDEVFSLYSSKNVTDTFKAQLKKIAANKHQANNVVCHIKSKEEENTKHEVLSNIEKGKIEKLDEPILIIDDESPNLSVEFNDKSLEDSIEIISEITPTRRTTRQSERLRKKRGQSKSKSASKNSTENNSHTSANKQSSRGRNTRSKGRNKQNRKAIDEVTLDDSPKQSENDDELNPELTVKVIWKSVNIKKFQIRKFQKLSYIFEQLSVEENIPEDKIMLTFNNVSVNHNDTPDSLKLQVYHFLDGGVLSELSNFSQAPNSENSESSSDSVIIKFQNANKKIIKLTLNKKEKFKVGMIKCSEQLEIPLDKIRFFFDGELIDPCETPESLGLENEEIIDIKINS